MWVCVCVSVRRYTHILSITIIYSWINGRTKAIQELSWYVTVPLKKKHVFFGEKKNWTRPVAVSAAMAESRAQRCHAHMPAAFMSTVWALHGVIQKQPETTLHNRVPSFQANMQKTRKHFGLDWGNDGWSKVEVRIFRIAAGTCVRIYLIYDLYIYICIYDWVLSTVATKLRSGWQLLISARIAFDFLATRREWYGKVLYLCWALPFALHSSVGRKHAKLLASSISICTWYGYHMWVTYQISHVSIYVLACWFVRLLFLCCFIIYRKWCTHYALQISRSTLN